MSLSAGQIIGGSYRIIRPIGAGGMASVYEVEHITLGVHYALKAFTFDADHAELFRKRFAIEGKILARLSHPSLVRVIDLKMDEAVGVLYYVMDLVAADDGDPRTLADLESGAVDEERVLFWFRQMCEAVDYIHEQGIVHRDIKLNNILMSSDDRVVLSDFGISKVSDEKLRQAVDVTVTMVTGTANGGHLAMGTQGYMAPEVADGGEVTPAADVYSLGVAFFRLLTNVWYDPCLAPAADSKDVIGMNSLKLLQFFDYNWDEVLPQMLEADPRKRPIRLVELASHIHRKDCQGSFNPRLKRVGVTVLAILVAVVTALAIRHLHSARPDPVEGAAASPAADRVAEEFWEAFGPGNIIVKETR